MSSPGGVRRCGWWQGRSVLWEDQETVCGSQRFHADEPSFIEKIIRDLKMVEGDQTKLDQVYDELCEGLKRNLKVVKGGKNSMSQPWFLENLAKLRKSMHRAEADCLKKKGSSDQGNSKNDYLRARNLYAKSVKKAKRDFQM